MARRPTAHRRGAILSWRSHLSEILVLLMLLKVLFHAVN